MNWGAKITIVFISFILLIGFLVYESVHTKIDLVSNEYYKDELHFQQQINGTNNANAISAVQVIPTDSLITIIFPKEVQHSNIHGEAWFYCKTNADYDKKLAIAANENGIMKVSKNDLFKTNYILKLKWMANNTNYYSEKNINLQ
jgi:hypothetical protein